MKIRYNWIALVLGTICLVLFAAKPYLLDFIEPAKSLGRIIGENAKDLVDGLNGDLPDISRERTKREVWSGIISTVAFICFAGTVVFSALRYEKGANNIQLISGVILALVGLGLFIWSLAIGFIGFCIIAILVVIVAFGAS
jgi:hypothetical protein